MSTNKRSNEKTGHNLQPDYHRRKKHVILLFPRVLLLNDYFSTGKNRPNEAKTDQNTEKTPDIAIFPLLMSLLVVSAPEKCDIWSTPKNVYQST